ncbi:MAG: SDR family oxidoreductase [Phycisphaerales bacterium]
MSQKRSDSRFRDAGAFVILGAAGGIGSAVARRLAFHGAPLVLGGRTVGPLEEIAAELDAKAVVMDATSFSEVNNTLEAGLQLNGGHIAGFVNCVGSILVKPAHLTTEEEWADTVAQNLTSAFATVQACARFMKNGGSVVLLGSCAGEIGLPSHEAIAAAKAGVSGLVRSAAASYARRNLRVNAVAPGLVDTPLAKSITKNERALETSRAMHPLGRIGDPEDIASAILWLLDPANDWITGQTIGVDGGLARLTGRSAG